MGGGGKNSGSSRANIFHRLKGTKFSQIQFPGTGDGGLWQERLTGAAAACCGHVSGSSTYTICYHNSVQGKIDLLLLLMG